MNHNRQKFDKDMRFIMSHETFYRGYTISANITADVVSFPRAMV